MKVRLNKFLSECGIASRRKSEEFINEGRVSVNGNKVSTLSFMVDEINDIVTLDGEKIRPEKKVYFLLNKPKGFITTTDDEKGRRKVTDLIKTPHKIFPVGRLDYDTTGVLLLTNDGNFSNFLTHPSNKIPREYFVLLDKPIAETDKIKLLDGIYLDRRKSKFTSITFPIKKSFSKLNVVTVEGRNHFVKRMFYTLGYTVKKLDRVNYGGFHVKGIPVGAYRKLSFSEIEKLLKKNDT